MGFFKKIGSALKKGVKAVGNVAGKVIGTVAPIAASFIPGGSLVVGAVEKGLSLIGGGSSSSSGVVTPQFTELPSVTNPAPTDTGLMGLIGDIRGLIQTASGVGASVKTIADNAGGTLSVLSGKESIKVEGTWGNLPSWLMPLLGGLAALLLLKPLLFGSSRGR